MHSRLKEILTYKQKEVNDLKKRWRHVEGSHTLYPTRDFKGMLSMDEAIGVIAEIKFASPSAGPIREKTDPVPIGRNYEMAGAAAISLLTDKTFFGGDLEQLPRLKHAISLPILRKDFIIDPCQVTESLFYGADAILLIARILSETQLKDLLCMTKELGIAALTEVHDEADLEKALSAGADIIGINNRNLDTFHVDVRTTLELAPLVPGGHIVVSESGIATEADIRLLKDAGVDAVLVGTALMKSRNLKEKAKELVEAGRRNGKGQNLWHNK